MKNVNYLLGQVRYIYICYSTFREWVKTTYIAYKIIILINIFLSINKRAKQRFERYCSLQWAAVTLFNYIILNRDIVNVTENVLGNFYKWECFIYLKPSRGRLLLYPLSTRFAIVGLISHKSPAVFVDWVTVSFVPRSGTRRFRSKVIKCRDRQVAQYRISRPRPFL